MEVEFEKIMGLGKILNDLWERAYSTAEGQETHLSGDEQIQQAKQQIQKLMLEEIKKRADVERLARKMHNEYEKEAKRVGWKTQESCQVSFDELPEENKKVMLAVAKAISKEFTRGWREGS